ncbi:MAG: putative selenium-dependent hydroxylase accessory protein YqeC [Acetatifactor sp.]|nr:putative selenium-dependent hydroxylase accessory protein YqeC [Acetatifactor sp.]
MRGQIIAVVGAGGKTTLIHQKTKEYVEEGKTVLVLTTTHMFKEPGMIFWRAEEEETFFSEVRSVLAEKGSCVAGKNDTDVRKFTALPQEIFGRLISMADVILVEADGSRQLPLKYPGEKEPAIPEPVDEVWVLQGEKGIGGKAGEVLHRQNLAEEVLRIKAEDTMTAEHMEQLFAIYREKIRKNHPEAKIVCLSV